MQNMFIFTKRKVLQIINYQSLSGKAGINRTDEAKPSSEHRCLVLAQPQANGVVIIINNKVEYYEF